MSKAARIKGVMVKDEDGIFARYPMTNKQAQRDYRIVMRARRVAGFSPSPKLAKPKLTKGIIKQFKAIQAMKVEEQPKGMEGYSKIMRLLSKGTHGRVIAQ